MTTTQIKRTEAAHVFGSTVSVVNATPGITDSANGFTYRDVGSAVTTTSTSGRTISSVTSPGVAVMDGNASASTGPQACTLTPALTTVVKAGGCASKTTAQVAVLLPGNRGLALMALNVWLNCGGAAGPAATRALKVLAAQGLIVQET